MAEGFLRALAPDRFVVQSAGTRATSVHPLAAQVMKEEGIDLSPSEPRLLTDELARWADIVIMMGCGDACPVIPGKRYIDWDLRDPKDMPIAEARTIRDDIKARIANLVKDLDRAAIRG